ncbi:MAG: vitamin K epoxide reductase family protein [Chthoniobacterales bacterium]
MSAKTTSSAVSPSTSRGRTFIYFGAACLALVGLGESTYLTALHLAGAHVVCVTGANCSAVLGSAYASYRGIPLAGVGALGYFTVFSCAILAAFQYRRASTFLGLTVGVMFLTTLWLLYLQAFVLHAFCEYCLFSAALIFLLAGLLVAAPAAREESLPHG